MTMFYPAKYKYLRNIISLRTSEAARGSVRKLEIEYKSAKTRGKKLRIARATQLAANRSAATLKRRNLSFHERQEYLEIQNIYATSARKMFARL